MYLLRSSILFVFFTFCFHQGFAQALIPKPPELKAKSYILMDANSGKVLVEYNADDPLPPASMTKMMTSYIAIHEIVLGNVAEDTLIPVSVKAWKKGGSKMWIREGTDVPLIDLLRGIIVQSGNDASIAVSEYFAGTEEGFSDLMNQYAQNFGMYNSNFLNATGWPAEGHLSTARDMAILAKHIIQDHPEYYPLYAEKYYEYNDIRQPNRNQLLWRDPSVDGLKTGHTEEAGYCLTTSAKRDDTRLIAVVMGTNSEQARTTETKKLLSYGFRYYETHKLYSAGEVLSTEKVWLGVDEQVNLTLAEDLFLTLPRGSKDQLDAQIITSDYLEAPFAQGDQLGTLIIRIDDEDLVEKPLIASAKVDEAGFIGVLIGKIKLFFIKLLG